MNKLLTGLSVVAVFGLALVANAYAMGSMHKNDMAMNYDVNRLIGTQVKNSEGEGLGSINDFVFDQGGRVIFAVLDHDSRFVAIPFSALSISGATPEEAKVVLNVDKQKLDGAPEFDRTKAMADRRWAADIYRYFGQQPYWTEPEAQPETVPGSGGVGY
jgi:hypothetical protein